MHSYNVAKNIKRVTAIVKNSHQIPNQVSERTAMRARKANIEYKTREPFEHLARSVIYAFVCCRLKL